MGWLRLKIKDDVEREFRIRIAEKGGKKGSLSKYLEEAIREWLKKEKQER